MKILRIPLLIVLVVVAGRTFTASAQMVTDTILHSFGEGSPDGNQPYAGLVQGSDSNFYGTTESGGTNGDGTVFRISSSGTYTTLYSFDGPPTDGWHPEAGLVQGSDSNFYGTTIFGGTNNNNNNCTGNGEGGCGTVFRISPSGTYTSLYSFAGYPDGSELRDGLVQGTNGSFYGTTFSGGAHASYGAVFRISPSGSETILHSFGLSLDGYEPWAGLVLGTDGNFYGATLAGGTNSCNCGTVFRISPSGTYTTLYSFANSALYADGSEPLGRLVQGVDGNFYGTTQYGGTSTNCPGGCGTVFRISPSGSETVLYSFTGYPTDGQAPIAGLVQGSDSNFYGTTQYGGTSTNCGQGCGTAFRISPSGTYTSLYSFAGPPDDGSSLVAGLVQGSDGNFYGTTEYGGRDSGGTVFELVLNGGGSTNCTFSITPTNAVFGATGGSDSVSVTASNGCAWTATNNNSFITITAGSSGSGNGTVAYTVAPNTNSSEQVGTMTIAGRTFTVTESGTTSSGGCTFSIGAKTSITLTAKGGSKSVNVKTKGTDCSWTAVSNDPFITIISGSNGTASGKVEFTVPGNTNNTALSGSMTIAGETYTVDQAAGGCTFKLSPKDGKIKSTGGTATIKVTPNLSDCTWVASSSSDFITILSGASGTGKGTVTYSVLTNATSNVLTGSIAVAGEIFTVIQAGVK